MLEFVKMQSWDGKEFLRAKGKKQSTTYTIIKNKSYRGNRYKVVAGVHILATNCILETAIRFCNEFEDRIQEPKSFKPII